MNIPLTHTNSNGAMGNTWMEIIGTYMAGDGFIQNDNEKQRFIPQNVNTKYYLTTWNNTAMIQTGHSNGESTEDERKVLANTLFYLKQLTHKTEVLDNSARDIADPNKPANITTAVNTDNTTNISFRKPEDNRKYI